MRYRALLHRRFESEGTPFAYVTPSASIVALDGAAAAVLDAFATGEGVDVEAWLGGQAFEDRAARRAAFDELVAMGLVRPAGEVLPPSPTLPPLPYPLATLVLNVTNRCNLSCTYCYEFGEDRLADRERSRTPMMAPETARQAVDLLFGSAAGRRGVTITFFGGETLLGFGTIRETVLYAEERARELGKEVGFSLTTNATLLTGDVIDFLVAHRFGVNVSIDGARDDHDRHRVFKSGRGSYDEIVPRIRALIARNRPGGRPIGARVTLTAGMGGIAETYRHLTEDLGFDEVGFAPVTSAPGRDYALSDASYRHLLAEFEILAEDYAAAAAAGRAHGFSNMNDLLRELHQGINKAHPCGAGLGLLGVSTEGDLGLCHRFVESGAHEIGHVATGVDEERRRAFLEAGHVSTKVACHSCFARPVCSGGCYHEAYVRYQDASKPNLHYCEWIRAWTDLGLRTYARIAVANPSFLARFEHAASERSSPPREHSFAGRLPRAPEGPTP